MSERTRTLRLGLAAHGNVYTAAYIGVQEGFFADHALEVRLSYPGVAGVVDALDGGTIDVGFTVFPDNVMRWVTEPKTNAVVIASGNSRAVNERWLLNGIMTTRGYLRSNRSEVVDFMKGMVESVHLMWLDYDRGAKYLAEDQGAARDIGLSQFSSVTSPLNLYRQVLGKVSKRLEISEEHISNALDFLMMVHGELDKVDPGIFYDRSVLEELEGEGFIDQVWSAKS